MLCSKMEEALNSQINAEYYSSYLYLSMAAYFDSINLVGMANWMRVQAQEEMAHAMKFFDFIAERSGRVTLASIDAPPNEWASPLAAFEDALAHERHISSRINKLVDLALAESDHATNNFLQWFVAEQVEEEATADGIVQQLRLVKDAPGGVFLLDRELGQRTFVPPSAAGP
ncbi:MAG: ferritin [Pirellulaceae bacterium]|jgi:ferritin|nr:ferritin [Thermoguttaceae bacterium]MDI9444737.1 ferritin [Planctomycetota bacterium]NLY99104.1 ferritin [Pirellulaceae bacterium]